MTKKSKIPNFAANFRVNSSLALWGTKPHVRIYYLYHNDICVSNFLQFAFRLHKVQRWYLSGSHILPDHDGFIDIVTHGVVEDHDLWPKIFICTGVCCFVITITTTSTTDSTATKTTVFPGFGCVVVVVVVAATFAVVFGLETVVSGGVAAIATIGDVFVVAVAVVVVVVIVVLVYVDYGG